VALSSAVFGAITEDGTLALGFAAARSAVALG
jgi:hypothetical protein